MLNITKTGTGDNAVYKANDVVIPNSVVQQMCAQGGKNLEELAKNKDLMRAVGVDIKQDGAIDMKLLKNIAARAAEQIMKLQQEG